MASFPDLGLRLHSGMAPRRSGDLARHAEAAGFHSIWFAENPYERGVLPAASLVAVETQRVRIGIGVFNPYNRHPSLMAMEMGALDELSNGRALLGIGSGVPQWIAKIMPHDRPLAALRDATEIARGLLSGAEVSYQGKVFSADRVKLGFTPPRPRLPIYLAAMADRSLRLCGALGDGLLIGNMCPPAYTAHARARLAEGAGKAGRAPPAAIVKYVPCSVGADGAAARARVKPVIGALLGSYWNAYGDSPHVRASIGDGNGIDPVQFAADLQRLAGGEPATEVLDDRFVAAYAVAGTAEDCLSQCSLLGDGGATEIVFSFIGDDPEAQMASLGDAVRVATRHHA